jgi:hypothetical protein
VPVPAGTRRLGVRRIGFKPLDTDVRVEAGGRTQVMVRLDPAPIETAKASPSTAPKADPPTKAESLRPGFVPLFNRRTMAGWKTHPLYPGGWRVEDGNLVGYGLGASHLFTTRSDFTDFHLYVEARISTFGNSGLMFRSSYASLNAKEKYPHGYEAQIVVFAMDPHKTGSLYLNPGGCVVSVPKSPVQPNAWFTEEVIAQGNHLVIKVNGQTTADYFDGKHISSMGHIALQHTGTQTVVEFRRVEIKELK